MTGIALWAVIGGGVLALFGILCAVFAWDARRCGERFSSTGAASAALLTIVIAFIGFLGVVA